MAIGDSIQAGLLKADFSPIERSGQSIGQGYKSLGQNLFMGSGGGTGGGTRSSRSGGSSPSGIGGAIERFSENKKKGEQAEAELLGLIETMSPSRLEDLDSGKSRFSKAYKRFIDGELTPNQTEALFGGLVLSEKRNNEVEEKQKLVDFSNFIMSGTEMDPEVVEDFNQAQPGLSALSGDPGARNQFLEYQRDNAPKTGPLGGELGSSDFARFAKEQGIDPVLAGSRFMNLQQAEAEAELANQRKAPDPQVQIKNENDLRKEFNSLPEVKDFNKVRTSYDKVVLAGENPSAAGDISMIFNYMKILDPGSVVREGEFATAQNAAGVPQRVVNQYNKIIKGERLSQDQRGDFMKQAQFAAKAQFKPVSEQMLRYEGVAQNMGLRFDQVLPASFLTMGEQLGQKFKTKPDSNSDSNAIKTDQGDYSIEGLSVEAQ